MSCCMRIDKRLWNETTISHETTISERILNCKNENEAKHILFYVIERQIFNSQQRPKICYSHNMFVVFSCISSKQILTWPEHYKHESHARLYSSPQSPITLSRSFPFFKTSWMLFTSSSSKTRENTALESLICSDRPSLTPTIDPATAGCNLAKHYRNSNCSSNNKSTENYGLK